MFSLINLMRVISEELKEWFGVVQFCLTSVSSHPCYVRCLREVVARPWVSLVQDKLLETVVEGD